MHRLLVVVALLALGALFAQPAAADEERALGPYRVTMSFAQTPLYAMQGNQLLIRVREGERPVSGLDETLLVRISLRNQASETMALAPVTAEPGLYAVSIILPRAGVYTFQLIGTAGGQQVDERFITGQNGFAEVLPQGRSYPKGSWAVMLFSLGLYLVGLAWLLGRAGRQRWRKRRGLATS